MDVVDPPFLLDFGKVSLDVPRELPEQTRIEHEERLRDMWGEHYRMVKRLLYRLEKYGITTKTQKLETS